MYELRHYLSQDGQDLFARWLDSLRDKQARARVAARLIRLNNGNFGDCRPVGSGVWELRVDWGLATGCITPSPASGSYCSVKGAISAPKPRTLNAPSSAGRNGNKGAHHEQNNNP